jgi:hypothetical protein
MNVLAQWSESTAPVTVDILVVYTPEAEIYANNSPFGCIDSLITEAMAITNTVMTNSNTGVNARLAGKYRMALTDAYLRNPYSLTGAYDNMVGGYGNKDDSDNIRILRRQYRADLVMAIYVNNNFGHGAGVSLPMRGNDPKEAFGMVAAAYAAGTQYSFAHEVCHLFGCAHDEDNDVNENFFSYSFGYRFTGNGGTRYRTLMAYASGNYQSSTRIPYLSSPNITYDGVVIGNATHDNAKTVRCTKTVIASFSEQLGGTEDELVKHPITLSAIGITQLATTSDFNEGENAYLAPNGSNFVFRFKKAAGYGNPTVSIDGSTPSAVAAENDIYTVRLENIASATSVAIAPAATGIDEIRQDDVIAEVDYYNLSGCKVIYPVRGAYIEKTIYQSGKTVSKVIIK